MPKLDGILETAIHTEDMVRARAFYEGVLGLEPILATTGCLLMLWPDTMSSWSFARAPRGRPLSCPAGPSLATVVTACCMWLSPLARTNSIVGRHISLRAGSISKDATIGNAVDAASISAIRTVTFWNWQRQDCGRSTRHSRVASHRPGSIRCPLCA